jgi:hypothetical protein
MENRININSRGRGLLLIFGLILAIHSVRVCANEELYSSLFGFIYDDSDSDTVYNCTIPNDCAYAPGRYVI